MSKRKILVAAGIGLAGYGMFELFLAHKRWTLRNRRADLTSQLLLHNHYKKYGSWNEANRVTGLLSPEETEKALSTVSDQLSDEVYHSPLLYVIEMNRAVRPE